MIAAADGRRYRSFLTHLDRSRLSHLFTMTNRGGTLFMASIEQAEFPARTSHLDVIDARFVDGIGTYFVERFAARRGALLSDSAGYDQWESMPRDDSGERVDGPHDVTDEPCRAEIDSFSNA